MKTNPDFRFKKQYGQNFITDKNLLDSIVRLAGIDSSCDVLEIGAGAGTLTRAIATKARRVISYEIDRDLQSVLDKVAADFNNVQIVFGDFMKARLSDIEENLTPNYYVVANIPYYITTPIITKLFDESNKLKSMVLMVQKEVASRFVAPAGTKEYGSISVYLNLFGDVRILKTIDKKMFTPVPKVDSAIIQIDINKDKFDIHNKPLLLNIIRLAFNNRRKMFMSNLKQVYDKQMLEECFREMGLNEQVRGEVLEPKDFVRLANLMDNKTKVQTM